ncbi:MAG: hypothetical protein N2D54_13125, partial [Chloroflexota bacterium]
MDKPGGNLLYAAGGGTIWLGKDETIGLVARVGEDYPRDWLKAISEAGYNLDGVKIVPEAIDLRAFRVYSDINSFSVSDPVKHFARIEMSFPKSLLGYKNHVGELDSKSELISTSIRQHELPQDYLYASAAHICPIDFLSHSLIPSALRQNGLKTITLDPGGGYMHPDFWDDLPGIVAGLTAFIPAEPEIRKLFKGKTEDLWEMAEEVGTWGCE